MLAVTPSRTAGYLDALEKLAPLVEEHRTSFDRDRKLPDTMFRFEPPAGVAIVNGELADSKTQGN